MNFHRFIFLAVALIASAFGQTVIDDSFGAQGTAGAGFYQVVNQSSAPSTPTSAVRFYANSSNIPAWIDASGNIFSFGPTSLTFASTGTTITGGAGNMIIKGGTGNSRTLSLQSTTAAGAAQTFLTGTTGAVTVGAVVAGIYNLSTTTPNFYVVPYGGGAGQYDDTSVIVFASAAGSTDGDNREVSEINFVAPDYTISTTKQKIVGFEVYRVGSTAGDRGGKIDIDTKTDGGALANAITINQTQRVLMPGNFTLNGVASFVNVTDATAGVGAIVVTGGVSVAKKFRVEDTTTASALGTASVVLLGGLSVAGGEYIGDTITSVKVNGAILNALSNTTGVVTMNLQNTSGYLTVGLENSTGGNQFSGTGAYSGIIGTAVNQPLWLGTNAVGRVKIPGAGGFAIGATSTVLGILSATATLDFGSILAAGNEDKTITVTGAAVGDTVDFGLPATVLAGAIFNAWVSATNTVTIRCNNAGSIAIDPASATYRATVIQF